MLSVVIPSPIILGIVMLTVIDAKYRTSAAMLSAAMPSAIILSVIILLVLMLNVIDAVFPNQANKRCYNECRYSSIIILSCHYAECH